MNSIIFVALLLFTTGCRAQMQAWQRERTVEHLSRLKNYHGHMTWTIAGETSETEIWFEVPNHFLTVSNNGEILRGDGSTMEIYDPRTKFYSVFRHLPSVTEANSQQLIRDLFNQSMKTFEFTLGPIGKVAGRTTIELRAKPKGNSVIESGKSQILDEYSFPLRSAITLNGGPSATYEFVDIAINEKFEFPKAKIPTEAIRLEWDFNAKSTPQKDKTPVFLGLKFEKSLKRETGEVLTYYRNGAQFVSIIRYNNLGFMPSRGIPVKVGTRSGFLLPGPVSNILTVSDGGTTSLYSSNLLIDDLIAFASR